MRATGCWRPVGSAPNPRMQLVLSLALSSSIPRKCRTGGIGPSITILPLLLFLFVFVFPVLVVSPFTPPPYPRPWSTVTETRRRLLRNRDERGQGEGSAGPPGCWPQDQLKCKARASATGGRSGLVMVSLPVAWSCQFPASPRP